MLFKKFIHKKYNDEEPILVARSFIFVTPTTAVVFRGFSHPGFVLPPFKTKPANLRCGKNRCGIFISGETKKLDFPTF
jgi:hypothetical protein